MEICKPTKVTRKQLAEDFKMRQETVSRLTLRLINRGLVGEFRPSPPYQKIRPEDTPGNIVSPVVSHLGAPYASNFSACRRHENFYCDLRADHYSPLPRNLAEFQKVYDRCQGFP